MKSGARETEKVNKGGLTTRIINRRAEWGGPPGLPGHHCIMEMFKWLRMSPIAHSAGPARARGQRRGASPPAEPGQRPLRHISRIPPEAEETRNEPVYTANGFIFP